MERLVLSRGLDFCIQLSKISKEQIFAGFELFFFSQLNLHEPASLVKLSRYKARLFELSLEYSLLSAD